MNTQHKPLTSTAIDHWEKHTLKLVLELQDTIREQAEDLRHVLSGLQYAYTHGGPTPVPDEEEMQKITAAIMNQDQFELADEVHETQLEVAALRADIDKLTAAITELTKK